MRRPKNTESDVLQPSATTDDTPPDDVISAPVDETADTAPPVDETAETAPRVIEVVPPFEPVPLSTAHVRIGGNPGVRVQQTGLTQQKRVTGANDEAGAADHRPVPLAVLEQVKALFDRPPPPPESSQQEIRLALFEQVRALRDLLDPWL